ncbi:DNA (cytosine-5-)-methyltransferase [Candidatus Albibeggiatoa sp. nov. NOAA]|uniref:DNA (cytosine-5-)-methyltransferase n=1 Tax=Candidatus Albibeggiatoa sp. nov. NOAA TaxID=3162724 RepID=UPI0032FC5C82|nr:DNA (cytosine-5-)-methyltransferase [Thiotrichaceae bacterium]
MEHIRFVDLFAGLGGIRIGFEQACTELNISSKCVFTSEIKSYAVDIYRYNFNDDIVEGDITKIDENKIPDFDFLLAGFPCQAFSTAGKRAGFDDVRGTLFFDIARILKAKQPAGFLLENVEGLVTHDKKASTDKIGHTLTTIIQILEDLGYHTTWKVLDAKNFQVPQSRKRIYIAGSLKNMVSLNEFVEKHAYFKDIREQGLPCLDTVFTRKLLELYSPEGLEGKSIKDKRGGTNNIHSWELELKGQLSNQQKELMGLLLRERRKKKWAELKGITWMDGMPLTLDEIHSFYNFLPKTKLQQLLDDMVCKKYIRYEHPKDLVMTEAGRKKREYATHLEKGYNIVTGKLSFELNKILGKNCIAPTIVATEADKIGVIDNNKIRRMSERECLRFFGFPEWYQSNISHKQLYDLIGNTVVVPVIKAVSHRILRTF